MEELIYIDIDFQQNIGQILVVHPGRSYALTIPNSARFFFHKASHFKLISSRILNKCIRNTYITWKYIKELTIKIRDLPLWCSSIFSTLPTGGARLTWPFSSKTSKDCSTNYQSKHNRIELGLIYACQ